MPVHSQEKNELLRKTEPELGEWREKNPFPVRHGGLQRSRGERASVVPNPVSWHRHRRAVLPSVFIIPGAAKQHQRLIPVSF